MFRRRLSRLAPCLVLLSACAPSATEVVHLGEEVRCAAPVAGFDRIRESGAERGLDLSYTFSDPVGEGECFHVPGPVVATDIDADGDADLVFHRRLQMPAVFLNDGGQFSAVDPWQGAEPTARDFLTLAAADLDGDGLPELLLGSPGAIEFSKNLGDGRLELPAPLYIEDGYPLSCPSSLVTGDVDADGDLDLLVTTLHVVPGPGVPIADSSRLGAPELLLINDGRFSLGETLLRRGLPGLSIFGAFTDRDDDGDLDLLVASDRPEGGLPPSAFFTNDGLDDAGLPRLNDAMEELGVNPYISGMGLGSADLNGDGRLDYCMSDMADQLACWMSEGDDYVDAGTALGLTRPPGTGLPGNEWVPWSLSLVDLDADGLLDLAAVAGAYSTTPNGDRLWRGQPDGTFEDRSDSSGFNSYDGHFGSAMADFDLDGYPDLAIRPGVGPVVFWENPCGEEAWVELELLGDEGNREGFGAQVELTVDGRVDRREMHGLRSLGQDDSTLHFGLGDAERVERIVVRWADGSVTEAEDLPVRRRIEVLHPSWG